MKLFLFCLVLLFPINCINGFNSWKQIDGKGYSFYKEKQTQEYAKAACNRNGGYLYEPKSETTYNNIISHAKNINLEDFWLGIYEKDGFFL